MQLPENVGFGRANNAGAKIAKGRKLFLLNPDTKLINNAIKILSDFLDNNADVGCCGGNLYYEDEMPACSFRKFLPGIFWELNEMFKTIPEQLIYRRGKIFNFSGKPCPVGYISGADLMIRKELFDTLSGFNPVFFMYYEEVELQFRIRKLNRKIFSVPSAKIIHLEGKSITSNIEREKHVIRSKGCYYKATQGKGKFYVLKVMCLVTLLSHFLVNNIIGKSERTKKFKALYREARDFKYWTGSVTDTGAAPEDQEST
jgi:GT2 family glycosyltransferase